MEGEGDGGGEDDDENDDDDGEEDFDDDDDEDVGRKRKAPAKRPTGSSQIKYLLTVVFFYLLDFHGAADFGTILFLRLLAQRQRGKSRHRYNKQQTQLSSPGFHHRHPLIYIHTVGC